MNLAKQLLTLSLLLLPCMTRAEAPLGYFMIGPMGHWNLGNFEIKSFSWGVEASYWLYQRDASADGFLRNSPSEEVPGYGLALGFDLEPESLRLYAEPEIGWVFVGASFGPVMEISRGEGGGSRLGLQGSAWLAALVGFDFRYRYMDGTHTQAIGTFAKAGALVTGRE
jgi:hypothetical protein